MYPRRWCTALYGAEYGQRSGEGVQPPQWDRERDWDTRAGTSELAIPKLRFGSYFSEWLLERRRRAEQALASGKASVELREDASRTHAREDWPFRQQRLELAPQGIIQP
ncbi:hypothetical protein GCM10023195_01360 [Actinoallomurus liliacearum]|uniref:Uncharacterized protein n=1 Tax=Actinoallomurus liliacearum TaxID=1080073 RepID=A0ABP8T8P7_9ACTN